MDVEKLFKPGDDLPSHYPEIEVDQFVVMPNHIHGVLILLDIPVGARHASPLQGKRNGLGDVVGSFKSAVAKRINERRDTPRATVWQRGFFEHIIRDDRSITRIREYILNNPQQWASDKENPGKRGDDDFNRWLTTAGKQPPSR